jgi:predicted esterase
MKVVKAMKKIIALFLVLASLICAFSACAGGAATTSGTESTLESTSASTTKASTAYPTLTPGEEEPQLVFHLDFSPSSLKDGKYIDLAGNGHDGIIHGNVENENGSAKFAGSENSYITIPDHPALHFSRKQSFTLEIRFKAEASSAWACIAQKGLADNTAPYYGFWLDSEGKLNMGIGSATSGTKNYASDEALGEGWHHAVLIQDAQAGTVLFYLDGKLQSSTFPKVGGTAPVPTGVKSEGEDFTIGTNFSDHFAGLIDDIKLYNYAVQENELLAEYEENVFALERRYFEYTDADTGKSFTLPYRIHYPSGYLEGDGEKYPVVLLMHGHGECGTDNVAQLRNSAGNIKNLMRKDNCIIIVPQCKCDNGINTEWVASKHNFANTNRKLTEKPTLALGALIALLDETVKNEKVDADRISAFGFSMGGFGVWELLVRRPDLISAAVICSAAGIPASADKVLDIDIRAYHGKKDETVPISGLELMDEAITALGGTKFTAAYFDDADHNSCINAASEKDGDLFAWLLSKTKAD